MPIRRTARALAAGAIAFCPTMALGGPPYSTDDPEPTDLRHWEIYAFATAARFKGRWEGESGLDLNYGAVKDVQLTATLPVDFASGDRTRFGFGDVELGVKYRFFHRERAGLAVAAFPRVILPTAARGLGSGKAALLLPIWAQKDIGGWSIFGGGGYMINPGPGNRDFWQSGLAVTRTLSDRLSLGAEIIHNSADAADTRSYTGLNFGGVYKLTGPFSILFSGGPGLAHAASGGKYNLYAALAINF